MGQYQYDVTCPQGHRLDAQKTLGALKRDEATRAAFWLLLVSPNPRRVVVIDESGTHLGMTPLRVHAPRGQRAYAQASRNYGIRLSVITALRVEGMGTAMTLEGAVDGAAFEVYIREVLAPHS